MSAKQPLSLETVMKLHVGIERVPNAGKQSCLRLFFTRLIRYALINSLLKKTSMLLKYMNKSCDFMIIVTRYMLFLLLTVIKEKT